MFKTDLTENCVVLGSAVFNMVTGDHLLILDKGNEFVTCHYRAGDTEWSWGHYTPISKMHGRISRFALNGT